MKAIRLLAPGRWEQVQIDAPGQPGPGEVLVRIHRVGICGSDISGYLGRMPFFSYPRIPGHELGVEVIAVGKGVDHLQPGDRCAVEPYMNCQKCFACRRGRSNCCEHNQTLGVHTDGGLCERMLLPARKLHKSDRLTFEQLALVETLAIGFHGVERAAPTRDDTVLVIGVGPIGLSAIEFLRLKETRIIAMDLNAERLAFCRTKMGISETLHVTGDGREHDRVRELTQGEGAPVVIDATGSARSMSAAVDYVAHSGRLVYVGITTDPLQFSHRNLHARELTLLCSRNALPADFRRIIRLIEEGRIDTQPWISHRTSFENFIDVFPTYAQPDSGVVKAMIEMDR
ncbi:MAG TPA: zinc-binding alcohol dehydrogenase family protein [Planctomycetaceae bacterium]|nr:zinc-binding alcohol dehydrogenase family protein [Planctomycetaceae bacterium]